MKVKLYLFVESHCAAQADPQFPLVLPQPRLMPGSQVRAHTLRLGRAGFCSSQKMCVTQGSAVEKAVFISGCGLGVVLSDQG